jgi:hypothetical protein
MKTTTKITGIKVTTGVNAGGLNSNHNSSGLKVRTAIKAGVTGLRSNHNVCVLALK